MSEPIKISNWCRLNKYYDEENKCDGYEVYNDTHEDELVGMNAAEFNRLAIEAPLFKKVVEALKEPVCQEFCQWCSNFIVDDERDHKGNCPRQQLLEEIAELEKK
jgi:hypothetical protein